MKDQEEGRQLLNAYVEAARAHSDAIGRGRLLEPGQRPMATALTQEYLDELRRLEEAMTSARARLDAWYRSE
jgi:hypothetical protein